MKLKVGDVMETSFNPKLAGLYKKIVVRPSTDLARAVRKMKLGGLLLMPVVFGKKVVGILKFGDLIKMPDLVEAKREIRMIKKADIKTEGVCMGCGMLEDISKHKSLELCSGCLKMISVTAV